MEYFKVVFIVGSFILSVVALVLSIGNIKRDKFKIQRDHIERLIGWHFLCVQNMIRLREIFKNAGENDKSEVTKLLSELSALIDQGRFFFPNFDRGDGHGAAKPLAYRGHRHGAISLLVFAYQIFDGDEATKHLDHAQELQREFTSIIYEIIKENKVTEKLGKMTGKFKIPEITYSRLLELSLDDLKKTLRSRDHN